MSQASRMNHRAWGARATCARAAALRLMAAILTAMPLRAAAAAVATASEDIRDIRGPKGVFPWWIVVAWVAGIALLAVGGYGAWRWRRRRVPAALLPFEIALQRLEAIRTLMHPSTVREFSTAISDIVRRYIEEGFSVTATHLTTEEFLRGLLDSSNASLAAHRNLLAHFLHQCDLAKFAGVSLSMRIMESLHQSARSFIVETSKAPAIAATQPYDSIPAT